MADKTDAPKLVANVPLSVPIVVEEGEDKKKNTIGSLAITRPKTKHVKKLAALIGPAAVEALFNQGKEVSQDDIVKALAGLLTSDRLDAATEIVADLCNVSSAVIDELDPVDLPAVLGAVAGFFPALPSIGSSSS